MSSRAGRGQVVVVEDVSVMASVVMASVVIVNEVFEVVIAESVVIVAIVMENASAKVSTVITNVTKRCECTRSCVAVDEEEVRSDRRREVEWHRGCQGTAGDVDEVSPAKIKGTAEMSRCH